MTNVHHLPLTLHPHQRTGRLQKKKLGGSNYNLYFLLPRAASSTACTFPVRRTTGSLIIPAFANKFRETSSWSGVNVDVRVVPSLSPFFLYCKNRNVLWWDEHTVYYTCRAFLSGKITPTCALHRALPGPVRPTIFFPHQTVYSPLSWPPLNDPVTPKAVGSQTKTFPSGAEHF